MDKDLDLDRAVAADIGNAFPAQLAREHDPAHAHCSGLLYALERVDAHLRGGVDRHLRRHLAQEGNNAEILDDEGVHAGAHRRRDRLPGLL